MGYTRIINQIVDTRGVTIDNLEYNVIKFTNPALNLLSG